MLNPVPKPPPKQRKPRTRLRTKSRLKSKSKGTPKEVIDGVLERDGPMCQHPGCSSLRVAPHHIVFRSGIPEKHKHDPRNIVMLCYLHHIHFVHGLSKEAEYWRRYWERWAVERFSWLGGQAMNLEEWEELRKGSKLSGGI